MSGSDDGGGGSGSGSGNVYPFPRLPLPGGVSPDQKPKRRESRRSRLTKTAAGLALILGAGGSVASMGGTDATATSPGAAAEVTAARVVDITQTPAVRKTSGSHRGAGTRTSPRPDGGPEGPTDDGGPSAA